MLDYFISPIWLWQDRSWALCRVFSGAGCLVQTPRSPDLGILFTVYPRKMVPVIGALPIAEGRRQEPMPGDYTAGDSFSTDAQTRLLHWPHVRRVSRIGHPSLQGRVHLV